MTVVLHSHATISTFPSLPQVGSSATPTAASPARRTFSRASLDTVPSFPGINVSSSDLASYIHQLRSYLPKASTLIDEKFADGAVSESVWGESQREVYSHPDEFATEFMDRSITSRWEKQTPKVHTSLFLETYTYNVLVLSQATLSISMFQEKSGRALVMKLLE